MIKIIYYLFLLVFFFFVDFLFIYWLYLVQISQITSFLRHIFDYLQVNRKPTLFSPLIKRDRQQLLTLQTQNHSPYVYWLLDLLNYTHKNSDFLAFCLITSLYCSRWGVENILGRIFSQTRATKIPFFLAPIPVSTLKLTTFTKPRQKVHILSLSCQPHRALVGFLLYFSDQRSSTNQEVELGVKAIKILELSSLLFVAC